MPFNSKTIISLVMLLFIPLSVAADVLHWGDTAVFFTSALAIAPLALWLSTATEELAIAAGPTIGGLMNALFGNATELIIALIALRSGLVDIVKASITGSILGDLLLVLGMAMFFGGLRYKEQTFQPIVVRVNGSSMTLAVAAIALPTMVINTSNFVDESAITNLSIIVAGVLITVYGLTLLFSLKTHSYLYDIGLVNLEEGAAMAGSAELATVSAGKAGFVAPSASLPDADVRAGFAETSTSLPDVDIKPASPTAPPTDRAQQAASAVSQDRKSPLPNAAPLPIHASTHPPTTKTWLWITILALATAGVAFESDLFVSVVDDVTQGFGLTPLFTGVVLLPFLGDVAGYVTAVRVAIKNNMDLTVSVAMGSSLLVALFVAPVLVLVGQWIDKPMDLNFNPFEVIAMAIAVTVVNLISLGGRSNWLDGTLLLATYIVLGVAFYYHPA